MGREHFSLVAWAPRAGRSVSRKAEPPRPAPQRPRVYALRAAAFGSFGVGEGVIMLEEFLDTGDLAVLDQRHLPVVERHLVAGSFYACGEADLRHGAIADLGQLAQLLSESVDRVEPVLEVAANAFMPSEGAGVWGILGSLPEDVLREEVEPVVEPPGLGRLVRGQNHVAGQPYVGAVGHPPRIYSVVARLGSASRHAHPPFCFRMILISARQADFHRSRGVAPPLGAGSSSEPVGTVACRALQHSLPGRAECSWQAKGAVARDEPGRVAHGDLCSARQPLLDRPPRALPVRVGWTSSFRIRSQT